MAHRITAVLISFPLIYLFFHSFSFLVGSVEQVYLYKTHILFPYLWKTTGAWKDDLYHLALTSPGRRSLVLIPWQPWLLGTHTQTRMRHRRHDRVSEKRLGWKEEKKCMDQESWKWKKMIFEHRTNRDGWYIISVRWLWPVRSNDSH